jgi:hypothetical protein
MYGDTDSIVNILMDPANTFIADMKGLSSWYDFSNLPPTHSLYNTDNRGVPGFWKIVIFNPKEIIAISS